ncbi:MAG: hypothetical protein HOV77_01940 [Hamadaea sp.]|uniref:hypothetical protein n=1 Tax=Hamadaea sp. TaxID=2024425 RepID=UPI0017953622|nr:hypothetical protein [Hamadaea sp.]NUT17924.1 hypothetical protein [Hamadaea sp.]
MSQFADAIARLTIDKDFARATRLQPDRVASLYRLTADEAEKLRQLADAAIADRAAALRALLAAAPDDEPTLTDAPAIGVPAGMPTLLTTKL